LLIGWTNLFTHAHARGPDLSRDTEAETDEGGAVPCVSTDCSSTPRLACEGGVVWSCKFVEGTGGFCPCPPGRLPPACTRPVAVIGERGFIRYANPTPIITANFRLELRLVTKRTDGVITSVNAGWCDETPLIVIVISSGAVFDDLSHGNAGASEVVRAISHPPDHLATARRS